MILVMVEKWENDQQLLRYMIPYTYKGFEIRQNGRFKRHGKGPSEITRLFWRICLMALSGNWDKCHEYVDSADKFFRQSIQAHQTTFQKLFVTIDFRQGSLSAYYNITYYVDQSGLKLRVLSTAPCQLELKAHTTSCSSLKL